MIYLEYHKETKQVVQIHENEPTITVDYEFALSDTFKIGDEFEWTIWINGVNESKNVTSYSAIRNNPNAKRLLQENEQLKADLGNILLESANDKFKIASLEATTGDLLMEVANLKLGGNA